MSIEKINQAKAEIAATSALMQTAFVKLMPLQNPVKVLPRLLQALEQ